MNRRSLLLGSATLAIAAPAFMRCTKASVPTLILDGDSQTAGRPFAGVAETQTWGAIVADAHGWGHTNCAIGGSTSPTTVSRIEQTLANAGDYYALMGFPNDAFISPTQSYSYNPYWTAPQPSAVALATCKSNMGFAVSRALALGKIPTLLTPFPFYDSNNLTQFPFYVEAMKAVGVDYGVPVIDVFGHFLQKWWASYTAQHPLPGPIFTSFYAMLGDGNMDEQHQSISGHNEIAQFILHDPANKASPLFLG